jgi:hypothetical protein
MKLLMFFLPLLSFGTIFSQINIEQKLLFNSRVSFGISYFSPINYDQSVGYGILMFDNTTFGIAIDFMSGGKRSDNMERMINLKNTFFLEFRPLSKKILSPIIRTEVGYQLYTNALNRKFNSNLVLFPENEEYYENSLGKFRSVSPFGMMDLGISIKNRNFEIYLVCGYSLSQINYFIVEEKKSLFSSISSSIGYSYRF